MERQLLLQFYRWLMSLSLPRIKRVQFSDRWISLIFLWSVLCDRPMSWACRRENWPSELAFAQLPSSSTLSRRLRSVSVQDWSARCATGGDARETWFASSGGTSTRSTSDHWIEVSPHASGKGIVAQAIRD